MPPRLVGLLTVTGLRQVNGLCDSGAHGSESSTNHRASGVSDRHLLSELFQGCEDFHLLLRVHVPRQLPHHDVPIHLHTNQLTSHPLSDWNGLKHTYNHILGLSHLPKSGSQLAWLFLGKKSDHLWGFESLANGSLDRLKSTEEMTGITI